MYIFIYSGSDVCRLYAENPKVSAPLYQNTFKSVYALTLCIYRGIFYLAKGRKIWLLYLNRDVNPVSSLLFCFLKSHSTGK